MSEMKARVAAALKAEFEPYRFFEEGEAERLAEAAIRAMREPTEDMTERGMVAAIPVHFKSEFYPAYFPLKGAAAASWREMIDAAMDGKKIEGERVGPALPRPPKQDIPRLTGRKKFKHGSPPPDWPMRDGVPVPVEQLSPKQREMVSPHLDYEDYKKACRDWKP